MKNFLNKRVDLAYIVISLFVTLIVVLIYCKASDAQEVKKVQNLTFVWDANTEKDLDGYRLYRSDTSGGYQFGKTFALATIGAGTETVVIDNVKPGYFVLTAFDKHGNESGPSEEAESLSPVDPSGLSITVIIEVNS
ncbi:MAG: hypothetical protein D8M57_13085 [Candidatus Scalindua sp. AMX11]|nr:MAG: hypothetical protein DWQ00_12005 [Candidatus Scalindua sp.]NOG83793.1 hypothetical protein [Planctomycetota bacterium]RZV82949.1 MAG: hypothetical protein EX341_09160 [Candidatus Scalindua sp. SCAELEC01]TDE64429.1 MAG: hypothetical protein D8M57_13085 [Candidatus Scalindua sp. AMX11]GJQ59756.1 MAG: hypothetical protein SCALA701_25570 [Candidatus Scalindua sp.]